MLLKSLLLSCSFALSMISYAKTIVVKNKEELSTANKAAKPGDSIILQNGTWENVIIKLNCAGTKENPVVFKAETAGKVLISGNSKLLLGGSFIIVDGLYFANGYAGDDAVLKFCIDKNQMANNCRVTNTVINDFNNPKRLDENYWVAFYGKNNRLDHCSFVNKKNIGVLLAVILDDDRSRENFHSIDHNYFGVRLPLASNGGEIIRVGVSQHCEFNSNTLITDNFFEHCDGEGEIISIKSGANIIRNNLFKECQGAVVFRHGDNNTVENNIFLGNNKKGTGGVRIINKGQWVINNFFYKCRGDGFRSPLSIMNGVPNSPANRYVAVSDAVIANNSFVECTPISFCEGSDTERSVPPVKVFFQNNIFYADKDKKLYKVYDEISGIKFSENQVSNTMPQQLPVGFNKTPLTATISDGILFPGYKKRPFVLIPDSLQKAAVQRLGYSLSSAPGLINKDFLLRIKNEASTACGAKWFTPKKYISSISNLKSDCKTANEIAELLAKNKNAVISINLTGKEYVFNSPLIISNDVKITSLQKSVIRFSSQSTTDFLFQLQAGKRLSLSNLNLELNGIKTKTFVTTDTSGSPNHSNVSLNNCVFTNLNSNFFRAAKSSVSDSISVNNCSFTNGNGILFSFTEETDKKGYYNVEKLTLKNNTFRDHKGQILAMLRGGNDESTMGPQLIFSSNETNNCFTESNAALIDIFGVQHSLFEKNIFYNCNYGKSLIHFDDAVRAMHLFRKNTLSKSGLVINDKFVRSENNTTQ